MAIQLSLNTRHKTVMFITLLGVGASLLAESSTQSILGIVVVGIAMAWAVGSNVRPVHFLLFAVGLIAAVGPLINDWRIYHEQRMEYERRLAEFRQRLPDFARLFPLPKVINLRPIGEALTFTNIQPLDSGGLSTDAPTRAEKQTAPKSDWWAANAPKGDAKQPQGQYPVDQLDEVQHPTLGKLRFPRAMPFEERNRLIQGLEAKYALGDVGQLAQYSAANNPFDLITASDRNEFKRIVESRMPSLSDRQKDLVREALVLVHSAEIHPKPEWFQEAVRANADPRLIPGSERPGVDMPPTFSPHESLSRNVIPAALGLVLATVGLTLYFKDRYVTSEWPSP